MELQDQLMRLCAEKHKTVLMVTHDVDEALLLADRIVMMTHGPAATVGEIVSVPFDRPRDRLTIIDDPLYHQIRNQLLGFLEKRTHVDVLTEKPAEQPLIRSLQVSEEELFVIEKYTGFNRFRGKFRKARPGTDEVSGLERADARALG
jgi:ABC-type proline/glycine betaine transport system ATPase subunit